MALPTLITIEYISSRINGNYAVISMSLFLSETKEISTIFFLNN